MSIILRALKKIQDQQEAQPSGGPAEIAPGEKAAADTVFAREVAEDWESPDAVPADAIMLGRGDERLTPFGVEAARPAAHHRFGLGPKALLILLICLGVFTTGWFASRIYVSVKLASGTNAPEPPPASEQTVRIIQAEEVVQPPSSRPVASEPAQTPPSTDEAATSSEGEPGAAESSRPQIARASVMESPLPPAQPASAQAPPESVVPAAAAAEPAQTPPAVKEALPQKPKRPELKINAIAWKNKEPKAIVNMQSVYEGDTIEGATVLAIRRKIIIFEFGGETFEVRF